MTKPPAVAAAHREELRVLLENLVEQCRILAESGLRPELERLLPAIKELGTRLGDPTVWPDSLVSELYATIDDPEQLQTLLAVHVDRAPLETIATLAGLLSIAAHLERTSLGTPTSRRLRRQAAPDDLRRVAWLRWLLELDEAAAAQDRASDLRSAPIGAQPHSSRPSDVIPHHGVRRSRGACHLEGPQRAAGLLQRSVPSPRRIAVASVRGGAGKTTLAALVAIELARHRADGVLAANADTGLGSLPHLLGMSTEGASSDLGPSSYGSLEADRLLRRTADGLWVLPRDPGSRLRGLPDTQALQATLATSSERVSTAVIDCGAGIKSPLNQALIGKSHGLILVAPATSLGTASINSALEWFTETGQATLPARTVIALVEHSPEQDAEQATAQLAPHGPAIVAVPFDAGLAAGRPLDTTKASAALQNAVACITHEVFSRALDAEACA